MGNGCNSKYIFLNMVIAGYSLVVHRYYRNRSRICRIRHVCTHITSLVPPLRLKCLNQARKGKPHVIVFCSYRFCLFLPFFYRSCSDTEHTKRRTKTKTKTKQKTHTTRHRKVKRRETSDIFDVRFKQACRLVSVWFGQVSLFTTFSFGHCVVCSSIYGFWLPLWYIQTLLNWLVLLIVFQLTYYYF
jgi:hypothetical protein